MCLYIRYCMMNSLLYDIFEPKYTAIPMDTKVYTEGIDYLDKLVIEHIMGVDNYEDYDENTYNAEYTYWNEVNMTVKVTPIKNTSMRWFWLNDPHGYTHHEAIGYEVISGELYAENLLE